MNADLDHLIELVPHVDPVTGAVVFAEPDDTTHADVAIRNGEITPVDGPAQQSAAVTLTNDRFSATLPGDDFSAIERAQASGQEVRIENGQLVYGPAGSTDAPSVKLTDDRFSALSAAELRAMQQLAASGAASRWIDDLRPAASMTGYFTPGTPGLYLRTKPTQLGDVLHCVVQRNTSTGLYESHLWGFMLNDNGTPRKVDIGRWIGRPGLSVHQVHAYPGVGGGGPVLCLSPNVHGGMSTLQECVVRSAQWARGMGEVLRGRPFPYRQ